MYGMIHRAVRQMVTETAGAETWREIERDAAVGPREMISALVYDDAVTFAIVTASAARLGITVDDALRRFGRYWIQFNVNGPYSNIIRFIGRDIETVIANLDRMHSALLATMPDASMPSFSIVESAPGLLRVRYNSERTGLDIFVAGLMEGLLDHFGHTGEVTRYPDGNHDGTDFLLRFGDRPAA
jgi:hypothetical protein